MKNSKKLFIKIMKVYAEFIARIDLKSMLFTLNDKHKDEQEKIDILNCWKEYYHTRLVNHLRTEFIELIDETYEPIELGGHKYAYSYAWEQVDKVAFDVSLNDYVAMRLEELEDC